MNDQEEYVELSQVFGTCSRCAESVRVLKDGTLKRHGCWGDHDLPLESSAYSLEASLESLTRKHRDRIERQAQGETLTLEELEKLRTRPPLIREYQRRIDAWRPGKLEQRTVHVKKRKKATEAQLKTCCMCGSRVKQKKSGELYIHTFREGSNCLGSGKTPLEVSAVDNNALRTQLAIDITTARVYLDRNLARRPEYFEDQIAVNCQLLELAENVLREHGFEVQPVTVNCLFLERSTNEGGDISPRSTSESWSSRRLESNTDLFAPNMSDFQGLAVTYVPFKQTMKGAAHMRHAADDDQEEPPAGARRGFLWRIFGG